MSPKKREKLIVRIQKMHALAEGERRAGNEIAANSAMQLVTKMMIANAISMLDVEGYSADDEQPIKRDSRVGRRAAWIRTLWHSVAECNNATTSYMPRTDRITVYGAESDIEVVEYLAVYLVRCVDRAAANYVARGKIDGQPTDRNGFLRSMVSTLAYRLRVMRREAEKAAREDHGDAAGTALLVLDNRLQRAKDFAGTHGLRKSRSSRYAYSAAGAAAGRKVPIHKGVEQGTAPAGRIA